jgi:DNA topoisomerase III
MDLRALVQKQTQDGRWGPFATGLLGGGFQIPRSGSHNDKAHPPIHPVNYVAPQVLNDEEKRVYEFVVRRFLACCAQDARGEATQIDVLYGTETFKASGLKVIERNYLDVYPYERWNDSNELPAFQEGEEFVPTEVKMTDGKTKAPGYLTEPELIALMDANGIGTDATMAEHIAKIKERKYVQTRQQSGQATEDESDAHVPVDQERGRGRGGRGRGRGRDGSNVGGSVRSNRAVDEFIPTTLGVALIEGYENLEFEISLSKPFLRKEVCFFFPISYASGSSYLRVLPNSDGAADEGNLQWPTHT